MAKQKNTKGSDVRTATVAKAGKRSGAKKHSSAAKSQVRSPWELDRESRDLLALNRRDDEVAANERKLVDIETLILEEKEKLMAWADKNITIGSTSHFAFQQMIGWDDVDVFFEDRTSAMPKYEYAVYYARLFGLRKLNEMKANMMPKQRHGGDDIDDECDPKFPHWG